MEDLLSSEGNKNKLISTDNICYGAAVLLARVDNGLPLDKEKILQENIKKCFSDKPLDAISDEDKAFINVVPQYLRDELEKDVISESGFLIFCRKDPQTNIAVQVSHIGYVKFAKNGFKFCHCNSAPLDVHIIHNQYKNSVSINNTSTFSASSINYYSLNEKCIAGLNSRPCSIICR